MTGRIRGDNQLSARSDVRDTSSAESARRIGAEANYTQYGTRARYCRIAIAATTQPSTVNVITTTQCRNSCGSPSSGARTMST